MSTISLVQIIQIGSETSELFSQRKKITYVLDTVMPVPKEGASEDEITHCIKYIDDSTLAQYYMLGSITPEL